MRFLKIKTTWTNTELGLLKLCLVCAGISLGLYFYKYVVEMFWGFVFVATLTGAYLFIQWFKKMDESN
ncbi:MAG TPA: hypothetical protein VK177_07015 [Flavobacteriales bacterium]|nr:hypothetical protein [Flavobacteriales bacterium]